MTATEIAIAQLDAAKLQVYITALAIFLGPLAGVFFAGWYQRKQDKRKDKMVVFLTLLMERKGTRTEAVAKALNSIDVIYADSPRITQLWQKYYGHLSTVPTPSDETMNHAWLELLQSMAHDLGYKKLGILDLDKFYMPQWQWEKQQTQKSMEETFMAFLRKMVEHSPQTTSENNNSIN